jgi:hypothetical protein
MDWGDLARRYTAVSLAGGGARAIVIPELQGRIVSFGRTNVLRVADPGELRYPNAGGIWFSLSDGNAIQWHPASITSGSVILNSTSGAGHALVMRVEVEGETLGIRVTASNTTGSSATVAILCRAEFAPEFFREGALVKRIEHPQQEWLLASGDGMVRIRNRFRVGDGTRCNFGWSRREAGALYTTVASPQVELAPGEQMSFTSEYDLA